MSDAYTERSFELGALDREDLLMISDSHNITVNEAYTAEQFRAAILAHEFPDNDTGGVHFTAHNTLGNSEGMNLARNIDAVRVAEAAADPIPTYNRTFALAFAVRGCTEADAENVTADQLRNALQRRIDALGDIEILEACGAPFDSCEEAPEARPILPAGDDFHLPSSDHDVTVCMTAMFMMNGLRDAENAYNIQHRVSTDSLAPAFMAAALDENGGWTGLVAELAEFACLSEQILTAPDRESDEYPGVYEYEVAEPFGKWYGEFCQNMARIPTREEGEVCLRKQIHAFFHP